MPNEKDDLQSTAEVEASNFLSAPVEVMAPVQSEPVAAVPSENWEDEIETWFARHFHGLGMTLSTEAYNICVAAKQDLKAFLGNFHKHPKA
jgi:hypothetical protein